MNKAIEKELASKRSSGKRVPPTGIRASEFWGRRPSSNSTKGERKAKLEVTCANKHTYKTDVKPPQHCPVCHVVVDRRGYV